MGKILSLLWHIPPYAAGYFIAAIPSFHRGVIVVRVHLFINSGISHSSWYGSRRLTAGITDRHQIRKPCTTIIAPGFIFVEEGSSSKLRINYLEFFRVIIGMCI